MGKGTGRWQKRWFVLKDGYLLYYGSFKKATDKFDQHLNKNCVKKVENLSMLPNLHVLLLSHNRLSAYEDLEHLKDCKALQSLDLQQNSIDDIRVLDLFKQIPDLRVRKELHDSISSQGSAKNSSKKKKN